MSGTCAQLGMIGRLGRSLGLGWVAYPVRDALDRALRRLGRPPLQVQTEGIRLHGYLRHRGFLQGLSDGRYEPLYRRLYLSRLRPGMMVVDGGAHVGLYTLLAARAVGETGSVLAFEPDPYNYAALQFNVGRASCPNVRLSPKAIGGEVGRAVFFQNPGTIASSLASRQGVGRCRPLEVSATTIDHELAQFRVVGALLVKLDIEGAELRAVRGMRQTLKRVRSVELFVELNPPALQDFGSGAEEFVGELERLGFRVGLIDEMAGAVVPIGPQSALPKGNLYCTRG